MLALFRATKKPELALRVQAVGTIEYEMDDV